jgi:beta-N-acetylhexosaminidase
MSKLKDYDVVIAGFCALEQKPAGLYGVTPALNSLLQIASLDRSAIIWFGNPYGVARLDMTKSSRSALLVAYQDNSYTHQVAVQVLFGAIGASGRLPVTVNEALSLRNGHQDCRQHQDAVRVSRKCRTFLGEADKQD